MYSARVQFKTFTKTENPAQYIFVNEVLTQRRSLVACQTRKLRADKKITVCLMHDGHLVIKANNNTIKRINSPKRHHDRERTRANATRKCERTLGMCVTQADLQVTHQVRWGSSMSSQFIACNGVKEEFSPYTWMDYMNN